MTSGRILELAVAAAMLVAAVLLYRRRATADQYGSQGAVILGVVAVMVAIHGLGLMQYRPTDTEIEMAKARSR